jgi:hypothetical protein
MAARGTMTRTVTKSSPGMHSRKPGKIVADTTSAIG